MTTSAYSPDVTVEVAFDGGANIDPASWTWTDVSSYVELQRGITITNGRTDEKATASPLQLTLTLDNTDGRFTPENTSGAYYPDVQIGRPGRVTALMPGNYITNSTFETDVTGWSGGGTVAPTLTRSSTQAYQGSYSCRVAWGTGGTGPVAQTTVTGLVVGQTYTFSAYAYVPTGDPDVRLGVSTIGTGSTMSTKNAWTRLTYTFTATATSHVAQVSPTTSPTAGDYVYIDAAMVNAGEGVVDFTSTVAASSTRAVAFVSEWAVEWPEGTEDFATATLTASGRLATLGQSGGLKSIIEETILQTGPVAYYTLGEGSDATAATDSSTSRQPKLRKLDLGGTDPAFGSATGPATDGLTGLTIANSGDAMHVTLEGLTAGSDYSVVWWFNTTDTSTANLLGFGDLWVNLNSWLANQIDLTTPATTATADPGGVVNDGLTHIAWLTWDDSTSTVSLYVDGALVADQTDATCHPGPELIVGNNYGLGDPQSGYTAAANFFHVAVWDRIINSLTEYVPIALAGASGFSSDTASTRFARWMDFVGMPTAGLSSETGQVTLSHIDTTGQTLESLFRIVETTEGGVLFDGRDGTITFHDKAHRANATDAFTLVGGSQQVGADLRPVLDAQQLVNDVTATNLSDTLSARYSDATSLSLFGPRREDVGLATDDEELPLQAAALRVNRYAAPRTRVPELAPVDVLTLDQATLQAIATATVGSRFGTLTLPSQAPSMSLYFFIEGWREVIAPESWTFAFNVSPAALSDVWVLDSDVYSVLDTTTVPSY